MDLVACANPPCKVVFKPERTSRRFCSRQCYYEGREPVGAAVRGCKRTFSAQHRSNIAASHARRRARRRPPETKRCSKCKRVLPTDSESWIFRKMWTVAGEAYFVLRMPCRSCRREDFTRLMRKWKRERPDELRAMATIRMRRWRSKQQGDGPRIRLDPVPFKDWLAVWQHIYELPNHEVVRAIVQATDMKKDSVEKKLYRIRREEVKVDLDFVDQVLCIAGQPDQLWVLYPDAA